MPTNEVTLTHVQYRILKAMLAGEVDPYGYALAVSLEENEVTVRSALRSLEEKGYIHRDKLQQTRQGPARQLYAVTSPVSAQKAIAAYNVVRREKIHKIALEIARLTSL